MSTEPAADTAGGGEFEDDLVSVAQIAGQAFMQLNEGGSTAAHEQASAIAQFCQEEGFSAEEAIAGAWFFILSFE